jgi:hypothetical protein
VTAQRLVSPDGRRVIVATSDDEIERLKGEGYVVPSERTAKAERANSGLEGQIRARESSTTEGQERISGNTARAALEGEDDESAAADRVAEKARARKSN